MQWAFFAAHQINRRLHAIPSAPAQSTACSLWQELRHHPWRNAAAVVAVMLGVALAFSVHLINASALGEFSSAVRAVNGQPDLELRGIQGTLDESGAMLGRPFSE